VGWEYGKPQDNSGYIVNMPGNRVPQWFVIFHEMGHNFNGVSQSFNGFTLTTGSTHNATYSEGLASLLAMWSWKYLKRYGEGLGQLALGSLDSGFGNSESYFRQTLAAYRTGGSNYATMDANVLDGILMEMYDAYGTKIWFDLFSTFFPAQEPLPVAIDSEAKQATWLVAALSASAGQDLRSRFTSEYGFPIDNAAWPEILSSVQARIGARDFVAPLHLSLKAGWNMVSVPLQISNNATSAVFPGVSAVFAWNPATKSYIIPTVIEPHRGYWVAVAQDTNLTLAGIPVDTWTSDLSAGWNMVGSVSVNAILAASDDNPDDSVIHAAYYWDPVTKSYTPANSIEQGKGYWVATVRDCDLTLP
jgi:hypothetical protein